MVRKILLLILIAKASARSLCAVGTVILHIEFLATGKLGRVWVVKGFPIRNLTELAVEAANKIEFEPATKNGNPVTVFRQVEYTYGWSHGGWKSPMPKMPETKKDLKTKRRASDATSPRDRPLNDFNDQRYKNPINFQQDG